MRLLEEMPGAVVNFRFSHALVREVVFDEIPSLERAELHERAADALLKVAGDSDDSAEIVAAHLVAAVPLVSRGRAAGALERAAAVAMRRFAYEATEQMLDEAVALRQGASGDDADPEAELLTIYQLTIARRFLGGYTGSVAATPLGRARELAQQTGRFDVLYELLWLDWASAATGCELDLADRLAAEILELAEAAEDPLVKAVAFGNWGIQCWHRGRIREAVEFLDRFHDTYTAAFGSETPVFATGTPLAEGLILAIGFRAIMHELAGDRNAHDDLSQLASSQIEPYAQVVSWTFDAFVAMVIGDADRAVTSGRRALAAEPNNAFLFFGSAAAMDTASGLSMQGRHDEALELFRVHVPRYRSTGVRTILPIYLASHAVALARAGRADQARVVQEEAEAVISETEEWWTQPVVSLRRAEVLHEVDGEPAEVRAALAASAEVANEQGSLGVARRAAQLAAEWGLEPLETP
jgi:tetratricopeptide (TPR) repeat protein